MIGRIVTVVARQQRLDESILNAFQPSHSLREGWASMAQTDRQRWLRPMVTYEGVKFPIYLDDSTQIKLSVEQDDGNPVISVDKNGTVHALQEGKAVLIGEFAGMTDSAG
jgi:hypothetical protein